MRRRHPGLEIERVVIHTSGDRFSLARPGALLDEEGAGNVKAMFVKEIEEALIAGAVDFAVHSSKDLPAELPEGLEIVCFPEREDPREVYIGGPSAPRWKDMNAGCALATASLRRRIQLGVCAPDVRFVTIRGNVDTRLRKLAAGQADGLLLAEAGLRRLGLSGVSREILSASQVVPAPGQGALAIEARADRDDVRRLLEPLDDAAARFEVGCERGFLRLMDGGCRTPLGALARVRGERMLFSWFWSDDAGRSPRRGSFECAARKDLFEAKAADLAGFLRAKALP